MTKRRTAMSFGTRNVLVAMAVLGVFSFQGAIRADEQPLGAEGSQKPLVLVYKTSFCGCCGKWVTHLEENGFETSVKEVATVAPLKAKHGVADQLVSCHTALIDGYVIEGHVPAEDIVRLLEERPDATGLTVPGMPMGSPGMEGSRRDPYEVLLFDKQGRTTVFSRH